MANRLKILVATAVSLLTVAALGVGALAGPGQGDERRNKDHVPAFVTDGLGRPSEGRGRPLFAAGDEKGMPMAVWRNGTCHDVNVPIIRTSEPDGTELVKTDVNAAVDAQAGKADPRREREPTQAEALDCQRRMPTASAPPRP